MEGKWNWDLKLKLNSPFILDSADQPLAFTHKHFGMEYMYMPTLGVGVSTGRHHLIFEIGKPWEKKQNALRRSCVVRVGKKIIL